ncbi:MAG: tripartite tricarboxylate transporter substrate binding protein [Hyphomicrobiales bacterium]|nr:tripartite tricarboxylate transporter substrate binding protein [Hyphomicrobiales bacterium]
MTGRDARRFPRRELLQSAIGVAVWAAVPLRARAQAYPARPVRLVVFFPPGGVGDITARLLAQWLSEHAGQPFVIDNRPGAGGSIGTEAVVRAAADGYTLLWATSPNAIAATLYDKLSYNFIQDLAPVAATLRVPNVMVVDPSLPVATVADFIAYAKANPGKLNFASGGNGTPTHVAGELFKLMAGVDILHVPYRGGAPALTDLIAGRVQGMFEALPSALEHIRAGRLRALAVTTTERSQILPDLPTVGDVLPGFEASTWFGVAAPRGTPAAIVDTLNTAINAGLADPKLKARIAELGGAVLGGSPADFGRLVSEETDKWAKVIRSANIKPE